MDTWKPTLLRLDAAKFYGPSRGAADIDMVVWHQTDDRLQYLDLLRYLNSGEDGKKSYHYHIDFDGTIRRLVPWNIRAYHAGASAWPVPSVGVLPWQSVNSRSIGIAFAGRLADALTPQQHGAGLWLYRQVLSIPVYVKFNVGHKEVAPGRRFDPGFSMDWWREELAKA